MVTVDLMTQKKYFALHLEYKCLTLTPFSTSIYALLTLRLSPMRVSRDKGPPIATSTSIRN